MLFVAFIQFVDSLPAPSKETQGQNTHTRVRPSFPTFSQVLFLSCRHLRSILGVFRTLKERILWKWDADSLQDFPSNVLTSPWLPQQDILGTYGRSLGQAFRQLAGWGIGERRFKEPSTTNKECLMKLLIFRCWGRHDVQSPANARPRKCVSGFDPSTFAAWGRRPARVPSHFLLISF